MSYTRVVLRFARTHMTPLAVAVAMLGVLTLSYGMVQQSLRLGANVQPQLLAQALAGAAAVDPSSAVAQLNPPTGVTALLVQDGRIVASKPDWSGALPPFGVLTSTGPSTVHGVTWQDATGLRRALVVAAVPNHAGLYALAFQPLAPTESVIDAITRLWLLGCTAVLIFATLWLVAHRHD